MNAIKTLLILAITTTTALSAQNNPLPPTVNVVGEGVVRVVPDEVTINIRVENTGDNVKILKEQNDATINEVLKFLKKMDIPEKYVKTEYMNLGKNYDYNTKTYTFSANQAISVKLHDLQKYEPVMKGLLDTGINRIDGVTFSTSKEEALRTEARKKAVENALMKAQEYAAALNQKVGKAVLIKEYGDSPEPRPMYRMAMMESAADGSSSIALGQMEIKTNIHISFLLN